MCSFIDPFMVLLPFLSQEFVEPFLSFVFTRFRKFPTFRQHPQWYRVARIKVGRHSTLQREMTITQF